MEPNIAAGPLKFPLSLQPVLHKRSGGGTSYNEVSYVPVIWLVDAENRALMLVQPELPAKGSASVLTMQVMARATGYLRWLEDVDASLRSAVQNIDEPSQYVHCDGSVDMAVSDGSITDLSLKIALRDDNDIEFDSVRYPISMAMSTGEVQTSINEVISLATRRRDAAQLVLSELAAAVGAWKESERVAPSGETDLNVRDTRSR